MVGLHQTLLVTMFVGGFGAIIYGFYAERGLLIALGIVLVLLSV